MNPVLSALASNISVDQIIEYVVTRYPQLREKVAFALDSGYNANDIMKMLKSYDKKGFKQAVESAIPKKERQQIEYSNQRRGRNLTLAEQAQSNERQTIEKKEDQLKNISKSALSIGALYAAPRIIPHIMEKISPTLKKGMDLLGGFQNNRGLPAPGPQAPTQTKSPMSSTPQPAPPAGQGTPQSPGPFTPPQAPRAPNPKHADLINQMGMGNVIQGLSSKENPTTIAQVLDQHFLSPAQKKWLTEQTQEPLENVIQDYLASQPQQAAEELSKQPEPTESLDLGTKPVEEKAKPMALSPSGDLGAIESENKGIATLDVDGRKKQFREQDVIKSPIPERDMTDIYEELIGKIPEEDRSAMINVAGYDPEHNELIFFPHGPGSALYVYKDIPPEFAEKLKAAMFQAKTTGENFYGAWAQGEESRGAGMFALIRDLQKTYGGKGKEYVRKYANVYDYFGPVKQAIKDKEKKKREEERARKGKKPRKPRSG